MINWIIVIVLFGTFSLGTLGGFIVKGKSDTWKSLILVKDLLLTIFYIIMVYLTIKLFTFDFIMQFIELFVGSVLILIGILTFTFIFGVAFGNLLEYLTKKKS